MKPYEKIKSGSSLSSAHFLLFVFLLLQFVVRRLNDVQMNSKTQTKKYARLDQETDFGDLLNVVYLCDK